MTSVESRLLALEKTNRRYRQLIISILGVILILGMLAFRKNEVPDTLQAKTLKSLMIRVRSWSA